MDKIEKVEIGDVFYSKYFNSWCQVVGFAENDYFYFKRNEKDIPMKSQIKIDYLVEHNLVFRNRELYPDQSQKQPEGEIPIMKVEDENGSYWVADNHIEEYPTESEKQEEWRKRITWEDGEYFMIDGKDADEEDLREFISQLLSERTRDAKQETIEDFISELECWKVAWIDRTKDKGAEYLRDGLLKMLNKDLSKLLKEEE